VNVIVFGGTRGIGRAVARILAARGDRVYLLGRAREDLEKSAKDLEIRRGGDAASVGIAECDLSRPETFGPALDQAAAALGPIDAVVMTAAEFGTQAELEQDLERTRALLTNNFSHTILFCELARRRLLPRGGSLVVVSSVAGDRGRKPVILYGAAKAGLSRYLEGLDHKFRADGLRVVTVKPGFVKTGMTAGLKPPPFAGEPKSVAEDIVRALDKGTPVIYTPWIWRYVMLVIKLLPRAVMRKIGF
jgi:decaprenylphospho-beta-D-erythro-pentofuranosid-2-ulose 2-reductase